MSNVKKTCCMILIATLLATVFGAYASLTGSEPVTLRFSWWGGDSRHEATLAAINLYMDKNPNVKIEAEYGGFDGYQQKLFTQLAGGTSADIMQIDQPWMADLMSKGDLFVNLSDYAGVIDISGFDSKFLSNYCTFDGKLVCLSTGLNGISFLGNKKVMADAGVNFSSVISWDDLINEGKKVNANNPNGYMINMDRGTHYFVARIYLYQLTGKPIVNDDYTIGFTKEELAEAFSYTLRLYDEKVIIPLQEALLFQGAPQDNPGWNDNQFGGWFNWASTATLNNWGEDAVALPYPILPNAKQSGYIVRPSQVLAIAKNSKNAEEAVKFLDFMFNNEEAVLLLKDCRSVPPVDRSRDLLNEKGLINKVVVDSVNLALKNIGNKETVLSGNTEISGVFDTVFEKLIYKQYDVAAAVDETFVLMQDVLDSLKAAG